MIKTENLRFAYSSEAPTPNVLKDINITIQPGEFVAILGHNGSGKSTLARHLNALLTPTMGTVWINGKDTNAEDCLWEIRQSVGMVFQNPDNQLVATIVEDDVAFGPENIGVPSEEIRTRVKETLQAVGMEAFAMSAPHNLSGGQKQRVAIAGVLAMRPSCVVLDEPTAMLDPSGRREVLNTITRLNSEGITIILITHFMEEAAVAKRVIVMHEGEAVLDATPREVFSQVDTMKKLTLSVPPVTEVAHMLRGAGIAVKGDALTVDEFMQDECIRKVLEGDAISELTKLSKECVTLPVSTEMTPSDVTFSVGTKSSTQGVAPPAFTKSSTQGVTLPVVSKSSANDTIPPYAYTFADVPTPASPIIQLTNLSHTYSAGSVFEMKALDRINLSINQGEMVAIIGHTGSGKSTLIQHLNGLLRPTDGQVQINGINIHDDRSNLRQVRQQVGLVFQYPEHQLFEATVYKDVAFGPTRMGLTQEEIDKHTKEALATVGIGEDLYEKSPFELSGGQKRRCAIAGVLAMRPQVLVLDEPAAGLDPKGREEILSQIKQMHQALGITVILVSHSMDDAARLTNRVIVLNHGKILYDDTPASVFANAEKLHEIGLDIPQANHLARKLNDANPQIPADIITADELVTSIVTLAHSNTTSRASNTPDNNTKGGVRS